VGFHFELAIAPSHCDLLASVANPDPDAPRWPPESGSCRYDRKHSRIVGTIRSRVNFLMNTFRKLGFIDFNGIRLKPARVSVVLHD
jgi:hypothetical protein